MGGHSLLSVKLVAEVRDVLSIELAIRDVFEYPQLSDLAKRIILASAATRPMVKALEREDNQFIPSYAQQRLWFIDQLDGGSIHYNMPSAMRVYGDFKLDIAEEAFKQIIRRHETLRTVFFDSADGPLQLIHKQYVQFLNLYSKYCVCFQHKFVQDLILQKIY